MRTRWTVLSVDPALEGLLPTAEAEAEAAAEAAAEVEAEAEVEAPSSERFAQAASRHGPMPNVLAPTPILALGRPHVLPKELRHARLAAQQGSARQLARRARLRDELGQVR